MTEQEEQSLIGHDISRLPPRVFRAIPAAVMALKKEIPDLLRKDASGNAALLEVSLNDPNFSTTPKVFTTVVIKRKSTGVFKARLVLRGDMVSLAQQQFTSAPTAHRSAIRLVLSLAANFRFSLLLLFHL